MKPEALNQMKESVDQDMIDKDEYPQRPELKTMLKHARQTLACIGFRSGSGNVGTSTTGSSGASMLGGMVLC